MARPVAQYTLNLNDAKRRAILRLLAFTAPGYLIFLPLILLSSLSARIIDGFSDWALTARLIGLPVCVLATWALLLLLRQVVTIKLYQPKLPLLVDKSAGKTSLSNLQAIKLQSESRILTLQFVSRIVEISIDRLDNGNIETLLYVIKKLPELDASSELVTELVKLKRRGNAGDVLKLRYASHMAMRRTIDALKEGERTIWSVWAVVWSLIGLYMIAAGVNYHDTFAYFLVASLHLPIYALGAAVAVATVPTSMILSSMSGHPVGQLMLALTTLMLLPWLRRILLQPNKLLVDKAGISKVMDCGLGEIPFEKIKWHNVSALTLLKPAGMTDPARWEIVFEQKNSSRPIKLRIGGLGNSENKALIFKAIQKYIPEVSRDPQIESALVESSAHSFTELWLSSLTTPPKRELLTPLNNGHVLSQGRYVIDKQFASGGQGVAYLARDMDLPDGNSVIIKESVLPLFVDKQARKKAVDKFEREALLLQKLGSNHVVRLLDYFIEDHRTYLVLEHIAGEDLRAKVEREGAMTAGQVLRLARQMSDILLYLQSLSPPVVHRDFTPDNLVLGFDQELKLIDFEVAHEQSQKNTATVVGKHCYIPPEQLRGKPELASDMYALGCSLYYLFTGKDPEPLTRQKLFDDSKAEPRTEEELILHNIIYELTALDPTKRLSNKGLRALLGLPPENLSGLSEASTEIDKIELLPEDNEHSQTDNSSELDGLVINLSPLKETV